MAVGVIFIATRPERISRVTLSQRFNHDVRAIDATFHFYLPLEKRILTGFNFDLKLKTRRNSLLLLSFSKTTRCFVFSFNCNYTLKEL